MSRQIAGLFPLLTLALGAAQSFQPNYDEAKVPEYTLPDPLVMTDATPVRDAQAWEKHRRPEVLELFRTHVYGRSPESPRELRFEVTEVEPAALGGLATRKQVTIDLTDQPDGPVGHLLIYLPNQADEPVPAFVGLNFYGNQAVHPDPGIRISSSWALPREQHGIIDGRPAEASRGTRQSYWQVEKIIRRGYALVMMHCGDMEPDHAAGWRDGVRGALQDEIDPTEPDAWGAIGAWAYGLSRALDYLENDAAIDASRVAVMGHSRLGKTALWAGAQDERFALVISNESGCGGAALSRRRFGETVGRINEAFPHWFCGNFKRYSDREEDLPVDQHELIALMAPRPVYVASAEDDRWADPRGEFLAAKQAGPVYALYGKDGIDVDEMPAPEHPVGDVVGYHIRPGAHAVTEYDWEQYLRFADRHLGQE